ncbi:MAG: hypothetical protein NTV36_01215 [Candidatus Staskawiczbacteria bacterium]|nr:hypothetical protein [Candidatus Staskawiczbacteria bacterium]
MFSNEEAIVILEQRLSRLDDDLCTSYQEDWVELYEGALTHFKNDAADEDDMDLVRIAKSANDTFVSDASIP